MTKSGSAVRQPGQICSIRLVLRDGFDGLSYTCLAKAAQGAPCSATDPCVDPYRCDSVSGTCMTRLVAGAFCSSSADCLATAPFCDQYVGCKCDLGLSFAAGAFDLRRLRWLAQRQRAGLRGGIVARRRNDQPVAPTRSSGG